ncbi:hypothetical protein DPMN_111232 [Dreissena polymorpha]|uniref:Uncharacterized protein n=1 Tax=Dreissena polymorpha TaxID=45954 RepID=A0A9D4KDG4_DREPO|nr:hypothetical protein DPMN_111232 [Dreissena polymorpha]
MAKLSVSSRNTEAFTCCSTQTVPSMPIVNRVTSKLFEMMVFVVIVSANVCDWSYWLPWNCTCCGPNVQKDSVLASRLRGICCEISTDAPECLRLCNVTYEDGNQKAACNRACPHKTTPSPCVSTPETRGGGGVAVDFRVNNKHVSPPEFFNNDANAVLRFIKNRHVTNILSLIGCASLDYLIKDHKSEYYASSRNSTNFDAASSDTIIFNKLGGVNVCRCVYFTQRHYASHRNPINFDAAPSDKIIYN